MKRARLVRGFTFVEIMLVVCLLSILSVTLFHTFSSGLKIWQRGFKTVDEEDAAIFFDKISEDLRNSLVFAQIPFQGKKDRISFATMVTTLQDARKKSSSGDYIRQIGRVEYYVDYADNGLYRRQANYSQALKKKFGSERLLVKSLKSISFEYYSKGKDDVQSSSNEIGEIPSVVKIQIEFGNENPRTMIKIVNIPVGV